MARSNLSEEDLAKMVARGNVKLKGGNPISPAVKPILVATGNPAKPKPKHDYKVEFEQQLAAVGIDLPVREYRFHPTRKWRFDYAYPDQKIAIEYQGGVYSKVKQGHQTTSGFERDCLKFSEAALMGWCLILITAGTVRDGKALKLVEKAIQLSISREQQALSPRLPHK